MGSQIKNCEWENGGGLFIVSIDCSYGCFANDPWWGDHVKIRFKLGSRTSACKLSLGRRIGENFINKISLADQGLSCCLGILLI
jgi:hypothetical protein